MTVHTIRKCWLNITTLNVVFRPMFRLIAYMRILSYIIIVCFLLNIASSVSWPGIRIHNKLKSYFHATTATIWHHCIKLLSCHESHREEIIQHIMVPKGGADMTLLFWLICMQQGYLKWGDTVCTVKTKLNYHFGFFVSNKENTPAVNLNKW